MSLKEWKKTVQKASISTSFNYYKAGERFWTKTPSLSLNRVLSGSIHRALPSKNLCAIVGPEHAFKSSFTVLCMADAYKQGHPCILIDTEGGLTDEFCMRWGLDVSDEDNVSLVHQPYVSEIYKIIASIKQDNIRDAVIAIDSAGSLDRFKNYDEALERGLVADQGLLQKDIRALLRLFLHTCISQNCVGIICGHKYGVPSQNPRFPKPDQIGGGRAMMLLPTTIIDLKKEKLFDNDKDRNIIGTKVTATTVKNRIYPPFNQATIEIDYKNGVNPNAGILDLAVNAGIIERNGAWYSYCGERLGQGRENVKNALGSVDGIFEDLENWLSTTGYSNASVELEEEAKQLIEEAEKEDAIS